MEQFDFPTAETKDVISKFLNRSCVLLRNFVDAAALDRAYDMTLKAYARVDGYHIHPDIIYASWGCRCTRTSCSASAISIC